MSVTIIVLTTRKDVIAMLFLAIGLGAYKVMTAICNLRLGKETEANLRTCRFTANKWREAIEAWKAAMKLTITQHPMSEHVMIINHLNEWCLEHGACSLERYLTEVVQSLEAIAEGRAMPDTELEALYEFFEAVANTSDFYYNRFGSLGTSRMRGPIFLFRTYSFISWAFDHLPSCYTPT